MAELALSVVLLIGAGLLVRSFAQLQQVAPGFNPADVLTLEVTMSGRKYADANAVIESYRQVWARLGRLPGVTAVGAVSALPLSQMFAWGPITVEGRMPPPGEKFINVDQRMVAGDYFRVMQIPLLEGRFFTEHDVRTGQRVAIVDRHMAEQIWPGESAVGKRVRIGGGDGTPPWTIVVGVVGRVKQYALDSDSRIAMYFAHTQFPTRAMNIVVRGGPSPEALSAPVRAEMQALDPDLPIYNVRTMADAGERVVGAPAVFDAAADAVCGAGARAGGDWHLQRDGVPGQPGNARAGHPDRARRDAAAHPHDGRRPRHVPRRHGHRRGRGGARSWSRDSWLRCSSASVRPTC